MLSTERINNMEQCPSCDSEECDKHISCPSCEGIGEYCVGDCEDGVWEICQECNGDGYVDA